MTDKEKLRLKDPRIFPTSEVLTLELGDSYAAYEAFQEYLPTLEIRQEWQWYTPHKVWSAKGQHSWTTPRGTNKEKTLYWLYVFDGYFSVAVWFKEKNRMEILGADINKKTKQTIIEAETMGKMPTFPVIFEVTTTELLADIYTLIKCKKGLEC
jgi:hypothetical protein